MNAQAEFPAAPPADEDLVVLIFKCQAAERRAFADGMGRGGPNEAKMRARAAEFEEQARDRRFILARRRRVRQGHPAFAQGQVPASRVARPAGAARERRDSGSVASRGGDSGDSSDEGEPGPGSGRQLDSTDARRSLVERIAALDALAGGEA